ncbi:MAG: hypothetical protein IVW52_05265 [Acidimicrobiales bacterium]|nr:hypothetical protein [Acidimicrobiales bacterium]
MPGNGADYSDLEPALVHENDYLLMGINGGRTYIPLQVIARVEVPYLYDTIAEGQLAGPLAASPSTDGITNTTFQTALQLGSSKVVAKPTDIFDLTRYPEWVYQAFLGIDPPWLRVFLQQPFRVDQRSLPIVYYTPNYPQEGYWDGYLSPVRRPSKKTQMWVLPGLSIALGYDNIEPQPAYPLLYFYINALNVAVVTDPELAYAMLTEPGKAKIYTVGGLQQVQYDPTSYYGITGFPITADKAKVTAGVTPVRQVTAGTRTVG